MNLFRITVLNLIFAAGLVAQPAVQGTVTGTIVDRATAHPVEYAAVVVKDKSDGKAVRSGASDAKGAFDLSGLPVGSYELSYGPLLQAEWGAIQGNLNLIWQKHVRASAPFDSDLRNRLDLNRL